MQAPSHQLFVRQIQGNVREKLDDSRRIAAYKKFKLYSYLLEHKGRDENYKTINEAEMLASFLPFVPNHNPEKQRRSETFRQTTLPVRRQASRTHSDSIGASQGTMKKTIIREAYHLYRKENVKEMRFMTSKSMTPAVRISKLTMMPHPEKQKHNVSKDSEISTIQPLAFTAKKEFLLRKKPVKPTQTFYLKEGVTITQRKDVAMRKQSICAWESDGDLWI